MNVNQNTAKMVGACFLTALITDMLGSELLESIILAPDYLSLVAASKTQLITGVLLGLICCAAVIGVPVLIYPIFKQYNKNMALVYLGFRFMETAIMIVILVSSISILPLSQEYVQAAAADAPHFKTVGAILKAQRYWGYLMYIVVFSFGASIFYYGLFISKLVPRFISIWGLIGIAILLTGAILDLFGVHFDMMVYGITMGLNELFLGGWLITKGFNSTSFVSAATTNYNRI